MPSNNLQNNNQNPNEINLPAIYQGIKKSIRYTLSKWYFILAFILIGALCGGLISYLYGINYVATSSYTVQSQQSSSLLNSALSLASSLGISSKTGTSSYDNNYFANLMRSKRIVKEVLLSNSTVNGKEDLLANHFYYASKFKKKWSDDELLKDFKFKHQSINKLSPIEDSVLSLYYDMILDKHLSIVYDPNIPFNQVKVSSISRDFSVAFNKLLLKKISDYYTNTITSYNLINIEIARYRVDSLSNAVKEIDNRVAKLKDASVNIIKQEAMISLNDALRNQSLLNIQYSAAVSNYELAKANMVSSAPILQIIDEPEYSVDVLSISFKLALLIGSLFSFIVSSLIIFLISFFRNN